MNMMADDITILTINEYNEKMLKGVADKICEVGLSDKIVALKKYTLGRTATVVWNTEPSDKWLESFDYMVETHTSLTFNHVKVEVDV